MISSEKGYRISVNTGRHILKVQAWGIWDGEEMELAENFRGELQEKVKEVSMNGKEWDEGISEEFYPYRRRSNHNHGKSDMNGIIRSDVTRWLEEDREGKRHV